MISRYDWCSYLNPLLHMTLELPIPTEEDINREYQDWYHQAFKWAYFVLKNVQLAQDIASDALEQLWRTCHREAIKDPRAWLRTAATRKAINEKKRKHHANRSLDVTPGEQGATLEPIIFPEFEVYLDVEPVHRCIQEKLTGTQLDIFGFLAQGLDFREIAAQTDRTERNVQDLISQIRRRGKACKEQFFPGV
jgi:DNA-directed RNA polymerase specialized sigma24 family protein